MRGPGLDSEPCASKQRQEAGEEDAEEQHRDGRGPEPRRPAPLAGEDQVGPGRAEQREQREQEHGQEHSSIISPISPAFRSLPHAFVSSGLGTST